MLKHLYVLAAFLTAVVAIRDPEIDDGFTFEQLLHRGDERSKVNVEDMVLSGIDSSADRCNDFYQYACGGFLNQSKSGYLYEASLALDQVALPIIRHNPAVNNFFESCVYLANNTITVPSRVKNMLIRLNTTETVEEIMRNLGYSAKYTPINVFLRNMQLFPVPRDNENTAALYFSFGIPRFSAQEDIVKEIIRQNDLIDPERMGKVVDAMNSFPKIEEVKPSNYNENQAKEHHQKETKTFSGRSIQTLVKAYPGAIGPMLESFFEGQKLDRMILDERFEDDNLAFIEEYLTTKPIGEIKDLLSYAIITSLASVYPRFKSKTKDRVLMKCFYQTMSTLKYMVGEEYIKLAFTKKKEKASKTLIDNIIQEAKLFLNDESSALDQATRQDFERKVDAIEVHLGGKKKASHFKDVSFDATDYFTNMVTITRISNKYLQSSIGRPIKGVDIIQAAQVNAFYHPLYNDLFIPAGILHPPMFETYYPAAMQHSILGYVLAHELTHSVDPRCIQVNQYGQGREDWYSSEEAKKILESRKQCYIDEYDQFEVRGTDGKLIGKVNGEFTVGENVADSGMELAYHAFKKTGNTDSIGDLTADQLFFITNAQVWCRNVDDETARMLLTEDVHSPPRARVNGVLMNFPKFAESFQCPVGSAMNPEKKCNWWGK